MRITVENVSYRYPHTKTSALHNITLELRSGDVLGVTGPNGSGKTTLLQLLAGLLKPVSGKIVVHHGGRQLAPWEARGLLVYHPPNPIILRGTVWDNIAAGPLLRGLPPERAKNAAARTAGKLGIQGLLHHRAKSLSRGQQMIVSIARLLAAGPRAIFLDEPGQSLDLVMKKRLIRLLREEASKGTIIAVASHDTLLLERLATRIVMLDSGEIVLRGGPEQLRRLL